MAYDHHYQYLIIRISDLNSEHIDSEREREKPNQIKPSKEVRTLDEGFETREVPEFYGGLLLHGFE